jgi:transitional endoplasmic reticulum ATPase
MSTATEKKKSSDKTLSEHNKAIHVAEIVNHGTKLILPDGMNLDEGIDLLKRRKTYLQEEISIQETFNVFPWDGAHALDTVLTNKYGWSPAEATPSFFGPIPPKMISIETDYKKVKQVPWGRFSLPGIQGYIETSVGRKDGRIMFQLNARILRMDEPGIKDLLNNLRTELTERSIYRGKAFKIRFRDDEGDQLDMPEPQFINTRDISEDMLVYSDDVQAAIDTNLFTPIRRVRDCIANGIPVKRGVLLGGPYGTGKTLAAKVASKLAVENGVTYVYVQRADELADAVMFANQYNDPACVVFCEDIDRAMKGDRTEHMDDILNIIDGIDTKNSNIIAVLTTNHLDDINPAMLRPGRLDAVINVEAPDAKAVEKLVRYYGGTTIKATTDLTEVCTVLAGRIPAVIAEVVKRAKLAQLSLQEAGTIVTEITPAALLQSAHTMEAQLTLLYKDRNAVVPTMDGMLREIVEGVVHTTAKKVAEVHERVM